MRLFCLASSAPYVSDPAAAGPSSPKTDHGADFTSIEIELAP